MTLESKVSKFCYNVPLIKQWFLKRSKKLSHALNSEKVLFFKGKRKVSFQIWKSFAMVESHFYFLWPAKEIEHPGHPKPKKVAENRCYFSDIYQLIYFLIKSAQTLPHWVFVRQTKVFIKIEPHWFFILNTLWFAALTYF